MSPRLRSADPRPPTPPPLLRRLGGPCVLPCRRPEPLRGLWPVPSWRLWGGAEVYNQHLPSQQPCPHHPGTAAEADGGGVAWPANGRVSQRQRLHFRERACHQLPASHHPPCLPLQSWTRACLPATGAAPRQRNLLPAAASAMRPCVPCCPQAMSLPRVWRGCCRWRQPPAPSLWTPAAELLRALSPCLLLFHTGAPPAAFCFLLEVPTGPTTAAHAAQHQSP